MAHTATPPNRAAEQPLDVAVIGAGPYGLSATAYLKHAGLSVRTFGDPMRTWTDRMPAGMFLKSRARASNMATPVPGFTLADYCSAAALHAPHGDEPVPIDLFIDYGHWFQKQCVPELERTLIVDVDGAPDGFSVRTDTGERFATRAVVVATGLTEHAYIPDPLAGLARSVRHAPVTHTSEHNDLGVFAGRDVAVIGAGQSALESAALLAEAGGRPTVVARGPEVLFNPQPPDRLRLVDRLQPDTPLGRGWHLLMCASGPGLIRRLPDDARLALVRRILGPAGGWWLRSRVLGRVPIRAKHEVVGATADGGGVRLEIAAPDGGRGTLLADHVLCGTGYRIDSDGSFPFLSAALRRRLERLQGWPRLGGGFESSVPGLYFVGFPASASYGPVMRFVCGTDYASARVADAVSRLVSA